MKIISYLKIALIVCLIAACEKDVSVSPKENEDKFAKIYIDSNPKGALIFINGRNMNKHTPDTIKYLDRYKQYNITLKLKYFKDFTFNKLLNDEINSENENDFFTLPNVYGNFTIQSNHSQVKVYINDVYKGITPLSMQNQIPGLYQIKLEKNDLITKIDSLELNSGQSKYETYNMIDTSLYVRFFDLGNKMKYVYTIGTTVNEDFYFFRSLEGYYHLHNNTMTPFNNDEPFVMNKKIVYEFYIDKNGITKAFSNSGVYNYINNKWEEDAYLNGIIGIRKVNKYIELNNSIIWIGTDNGLILIDNGVVKEFNSKNSILRSSSVEDIYANGDGTIYISTNMTKEIYKYFNGNLKFWKNYDVKKFIKKNSNEFFILTNPVLSSMGSIMVPEELVVYNESGQINKYTHEYFQMTRFYNINKIKIDPSGNYWVATNLGVVVLDKDFNYQLKYTSTELNKNDLNVSDLLFTKNKEVLFCTFGNGVIRFKQYKDNNWF